MNRDHRILKHKEFAEILANSPFVKGSNFVIHYRQNEASKLRVGINVSKKNGNAVKRNRIRRQVRSIVDSEFDPGSPIDAVIVAKAAYDPTQFHVATDELKNLWAMIGEKIEK